MKKSFIRKLFLSSFACLIPLLIGIIFWDLLPDELVRHIGPGVIAYTPKSVMIFVVPLVLFVVHVTVCLKSEWFKPVNPKWRFWQIPMVSIFIFLISVIFVVLV